MDTQDRPDPLATARALGPAIAAAADEIEQTRRIPAPLLTQLHASRLFRLLLPRSVGGEQTDPGTYLLAIEEIARHDGSVGWNMFVANSSALIAAFLEPEVARTIFADPRDLVSWGPPNAARARPSPAAIASPAGGISPAAAARPTGWARTAMWSRPTARCASIASAGR